MLMVVEAPPVLPPSGHARHYKPPPLHARRSIHARRHRERSAMTPKDARLMLLLMLRLCAGGNPDEERHKPGDAESPCELKTVTVSTLPVLRENEFSFTGAGSGSLSGGESRLLLFVRTDLPGRISVLDDLDNTALPYFTLGES